MNKQLVGEGRFHLFTSVPSRQNFRYFSFDFLCLSLSVHFFFYPKCSLSICIIRSKKRNIHLSGSQTVFSPILLKFSFQGRRTFLSEEQSFLIKIWSTL